MAINQPGSPFFPINNFNSFHDHVILNFSHLQPGDWKTNPPWAILSQFTILTMVKLPAVEAFG